MERLSVIKIGGNVIDDKEKLMDFLERFKSLAGHKVLVHGGGKIATRLAEDLGIETQMVEGRRVTDEQTLPLVTMVYAGLVNKNIVAKLQQLGCNTLGLSGADLNVMPARKRVHPTVDFGFVGDMDQEPQVGALLPLLDRGVTLAFCALTHDEQGNMLNTNADTIASALAVAFSTHFEVDLVYCFEKKGVLRDAEDDASVISALNPNSFASLKNEGIIKDGMIPKLTNAFEAIKQGVSRVLIKQADDLLVQEGTVIEG